MDDKTVSYIILKPIAERFSRVAKEISDDEIKLLIKDAMRQQLKEIHFGGMIRDIVDDYMEDSDNINTIIDIISDSIKARFR